MVAVKDVEAWGGPAFWNGTVPTIANSAWKEKARQLLDEVQSRNFGHKTLTKSLCSMLEWLLERNVDVAVKEPATWLKGDSKLCQIWTNWPPSDWSFEFSRKTCTIPGSVMGPLKEIPQSWLAAELTALTAKTQALHKVISSYEAVYEQHARRNGKLDFSDLPLLLRK